MKSKLEWQTYLILFLLAVLFLVVSFILEDPKRTLSQSLSTELVGAMIFKFLFDRFNEKEKNKNRAFFDVGIVGLMNWLDNKIESKKARKKVLLINYYIPEIEEVCRILKTRILDSEIQEIEVFLVDNRDNSQGISLLKNRSETFSPSPNNHLEVRKNLLELSNLAAEVLQYHNLKTFKVYLFNLMPTMAISQFNDKDAIISFYLYNQRAYNSLQFQIDLSKKSEFVKHVLEHIQFLKNSITSADCCFDLKKQEEIEKLVNQQKNMA